MKKFLTALLILAAIVLQGMGGYMDYTQKDNIGYLTRDHAWSDAMFLLLLAIAINLMK